MIDFLHQGHIHSNKATPPNNVTPWDYWSVNYILTTTGLYRLPDIWETQWVIVMWYCGKCSDPFSFSDSTSPPLQDSADRRNCRLKVLGLSWCSICSTWGLVWLQKMASSGSAFPITRRLCKSYIDSMEIPLYLFSTSFSNCPPIPVLPVLTSPDLSHSQPHQASVNPWNLFYFPIPEKLLFPPLSPACCLATLCLWSLQNYILLYS